MTDENTEYTFMIVHAISFGKTDNQVFFLGRMPNEGEAVEMVYVGNNDEGAMRFQLRVKGLTNA